MSTVTQLATCNIFFSYPTTQTNEFTFSITIILDWQQFVYPKYVCVSLEVENCGVMFFVKFLDD